MALKSLSLDPIVNVIVNLSLRAAPRKGFNLGLIIGPSNIITASDRLRVYQSVEEMAEDGFTSETSEYKAALLYFSTSKKPTQVMVGVKLESETYLEAVKACREKDSEWYVVFCCDATNEDTLAIAEYIEAASPSSYYFYNTQERALLEGTEGNVGSILKGKLYRRVLGQYSTDNNYAAASIMGYAMGANTGTRNSAYTLAYKTEPGVTAEALTSNQVRNIKNENVNVYINRGEYYNVFEQGHSASGIPFDEMINLDKFANDIQLSVMDELYRNPKVAQTEGGMTLLFNAIKEPCVQANRIGFIASGVWKGQTILDLEYGDTVPDGYLLQSESFDEQSQADREARKSPSIYIALKLAGAIEFVVIQVDVNR